MSSIFRSIAAFIRARIILRNCVLGGWRVRMRGRAHVNANGQIRIDDDVSIHSFLSRVQLSAGKEATIEIGEGTFINNGTVISSREHISIGKRCQIAPHVIIMDCDFHGVDDRHGEMPSAPIRIGDDVWLATRCTILKGVTIGEGSVVAAGAVVTRDVPAHTLVAGVPARPIRRVGHEPTTQAA